MLSLGLLIVRVVVGLTLASHGAQKLFGWFGGPRIEGFSNVLEHLGIRPSRPQAYLAGLSEFVGGLLVALGLLSPIGNFVAVGAMVVAIVAVHWTKGFFSSNGGYEFPLLIASTMLALVFTGPGAYSLDHVVGLRLPEPATAIVMAILMLGGIVSALGSRKWKGFVPFERRQPV